MPGTSVSETSWHREARYRRASGTGRWVRAGRARLAGYTELRSTHTHVCLQVPECVFRAVSCLQGPGVAPVLRCAPTPAGLSLQLQRPAVFEHVLGALATYATPAKPASPGPRVVLCCPALRSDPGTLRLSQLRAVLVADHLLRVLRAHG